jgi:orotate phosphoribosyltransferase
MKQQEVLAFLERNGAVCLDSHFVLTPKEIPPGSGVKRFVHSDTFVAKDRVFENSQDLWQLAIEITDRYLEETGHSERCDFVLGLEKGAIGLASMVACSLQLDGLRHIRAGYAEAKPGGGFAINRGFARDYKDRRVLIVDDIMTSGTSVRGAIDAVKENGGIPSCVFVICLRGDADTAGVPLHYLYKLEGAQTWLEEECPRCADPNWGPESVRLDVNKHGVDFLKRKGLVPTHR